MGVPLIGAIYEDDPNVGMYALPLLIWYPLQLIVGSLLIPYLRVFVANEESRRLSIILDDINSNDDGNGNLDNDMGMKSIHLMHANADNKDDSIIASCYVVQSSNEDDVIRTKVDARSPSSSRQHGYQQGLSQAANDVGSIDHPPRMESSGEEEEEERGIISESYNVDDDEDDDDNDDDSFDSEALLHHRQLFYGARRTTTTTTTTTSSRSSPASTAATVVSSSTAGTRRRPPSTLPHYYSDPPRYHTHHNYHNHNPRHVRSTTSTSADDDDDDDDDIGTVVSTAWTEAWSVSYY